MLSILRIQNFALIDKLEIQFDIGLNIITGTTGAGKSILVGALDLVLGGRGSEEIIRSGESTAIIEAEFIIDSDLIKNRIKAMVDFSVNFDPLIIRREYKTKGGGRAFIGGNQVNLAVIKSVATNLADILGQHSHQTLLDISTHRSFLDNFAGLEDKVSKIGDLYQLASKMRGQLLNSDRLIKEIIDKIELVSFQINEIEQARLETGEEEKLKSEKKLLENAQKIRESLDYTKGVLVENEASAIEQLGMALKNLAPFSDISDDIRELTPKLSLSLDNLREVIIDLNNLASKLEFDPVRLEIVNDRLSEISKLKKRYGPDIASILTFAENAGTELVDLKSRRFDFNDLRKLFENACLDLNKLAHEISAIREKFKPEFEIAVIQRLGGMGMPKAQFIVNISQKKIEDGFYKTGNEFLDGDEGGFDIIEFQFSANPGEELKPLARIASGGEISRVMLAIKNSISEAYYRTCEIFDEVDVGISGDIAFKVGRQLKELSKNHQVICITHLHQIASHADQHFKVFKQAAAGRNITRVRKLSRDERIHEIAGLISGKKITDTSIANAKKLLEESNR